MSSKKAQSTKNNGRARALRSLQHQTLPQTTCQGVDAEVWFRGLVQERDPNASRERRWSTKDQVYDEALAWFLERHADTALAQYPARRTTDEDLTFWIDTRLMERARAMAQRDGVKVARLLDAAFSAYVRQCVGPELLQFRQQVQQQASKLYLASAARRARMKANASARASE